MMDIWTLWILGHGGYKDMLDILSSWIFRYDGYLGIMGKINFPAKFIPGNDTFEAL